MFVEDYQGKSAGFTSMETRKASMKISISSLSEGVHTYRFTAEPTLIGLGDNFTQEVLVDVTLDKTSRELFLKAEAKTSGRFVCDRCVDEFERRLVVNYHVVYVYDDRDKSKYTAGEVQVLSVGTTHIDLSEDIRQFLMLAVPLKLLCNDGCRGLCPHCGANWNHATCSCQEDVPDARWHALKKHLPD